MGRSPLGHNSPLSMLSCLGRCLNAVRAYYNYCPSYTSRITSWDLLPQMTGRLAAREEVASRVVPPLQQLALAWKCLQQLFFHVDVARMGNFRPLPDWNISPQESHCWPQLFRLRPQLGTSARRSVISCSGPRRPVPIHTERIHFVNLAFFPPFLTL